MKTAIKFGREYNREAVRILLDEIKKRAVYADYGLIEDEIPDPKDVEKADGS